MITRYFPSIYGINCKWTTFPIFKIVKNIEIQRMNSIIDIYTYSLESMGSMNYKNFA